MVLSAGESKVGPRFILTTCNPGHFSGSNRLLLNHCSGLATLFNVLLQGFVQESMQS
jgi:hypothetical protein